MSELAYRRSQTIAWNRIGEDLIAYQFSGNKKFFQLNPTAACVWEALEQPKTATELVNLLCADFSVHPSQAETDVRELLGKMISEELIFES